MIWQTIQEWAGIKAGAVGQKLPMDSGLNTQVYAFPQEALPDSPLKAGMIMLEENAMRGMPNVFQQFAADEPDAVASNNEMLDKPKLCGTCTLRKDGVCHNALSLYVGNSRDDNETCLNWSDFVIKIEAAKPDLNEAREFVAASLPEVPEKQGLCFNCAHPTDSVDPMLDQKVCGNPESRMFKRPIIMTAGCDGFKLRPGEPTPEIMLDGSPVPEGQRAVTIISRDTLDIKVSDAGQARPYTRAEFIAAMDGGMTHLVEKSTGEVMAISLLNRLPDGKHIELASLALRLSYREVFETLTKLDGSIVGVHETQ